MDTHLYTNSFYKVDDGSTLLPVDGPCRDLRSCF